MIHLISAPENVLCSNPSIFTFDIDHVDEIAFVLTENTEIIEVGCMRILELLKRSQRQLAYQNKNPSFIWAKDQHSNRSSEVSRNFEIWMLSPQVAVPSELSGNEKFFDENSLSYREIGGFKFTLYQPQYQITNLIRINLDPNDSSCGLVLDMASNSIEFCAR